MGMLLLGLEPNRYFSEPMSSPREIWSVRVQRELLALDQPPNTGDIKDEDSSSPKNSSVVGILPPFIHVKDHELDIAKGLCHVYFNVLVEDVDVDATVDPQQQEVEEAMMLVEPKLNVSQDENETVEKEGEGETQRKEPEEETTSEMETKKEDQEETSQVQKETVTVTILMDVSLDLSSSSSKDSRDCYPFSKPKATLSSGANYFQTTFQNTPIQNGDQILIDCDWTPSLHLKDAALNVALKVRESIKRGEPCLKIILPQEEQDDHFLSTKANSFFSNLRTRASAMAEELDKAMEDKKPKKLMRTPRRKGRNQQSEDVVEEVPKKIVTSSNIEIGDEIDLSLEPWNGAVGMYPCKAIRRPEFIEEAIAAATAEQETNKKVSTWFEEENEDAPMQPYSAGNYMQLQSGSIFEVGFD